MSYIEREAAIKCAVGALKGIPHITAVDVASALEEMPAADVVEVVRCKDCWKRYKQCFDKTLNDDDFCSYGERRKEE